MFYHPDDSHATMILKHLAFWLCMFVMVGFFVFLFHDDLKVPQKKIIIPIDITNKINVCTPEDSENSAEFRLNFDD
jgi:hypothetical protein